MGAVRTFRNRKILDDEEDIIIELERHPDLGLSVADTMRLVFKGSASFPEGLNDEEAARVLELAGKRNVEIPQKR